MTLDQVIEQQTARPTRQYADELHRLAKANRDLDAEPAKVADLARALGKSSAAVRADYAAVVEYLRLEERASPARMGELFRRAQDALCEHRAFDLDGKSRAIRRRELPNAETDRLIAEVEAESERLAAAARAAGLGFAHAEDDRSALAELAKAHLDLFPSHVGWTRPAIEQPEPAPEPKAAPAPKPKPPATVYLVETLSGELIGSADNGPAYFGSKRKAEAAIEDANPPLALRRVVLSRGAAVELARELLTERELPGAEHVGERFRLWPRPKPRPAAEFSHRAPIEW